MTKNIVKILILINIIIVILICYNFLEKNNLKASIILLGNKEITIFQGTNYIDDGYIALDDNNNDISNKVQVIGEVNTNIPGQYTLIYQIKNFFNKIEIKRIVNVVEDYLKDINLTLNGPKTINLDLNEKYQELGVICINKENSNLSSNVLINSNLDISKVGNYIINYSITINNQTKSIERYVNVYEKKYQYILSNNQYTNQEIEGIVMINTNNYLYAIDENNIKHYENSFNYSFSKNGSYTFQIHDKDNNIENYVISITNIDKEPPNGTCDSLYNNILNVNVNATDNNKIKEYVYIVNNNEYNSNDNTISLNTKSDIVKVLIYDEANNFKEISCNTIYSPINPVNNENLVAFENKDTLRIWIEKIDRTNRTNYYVTHIWAKDAYKQMKTEIPNDFGKNLQTSNTLLNNAINKYNLNNKLIVGVNASGFVLHGTFGEYFYESNKQWNKTSESPIVIYNGVLLRDLTYGSIPSECSDTYGIGKDGYLKYYKYKMGTNLPSNKAIANKLINDGVNYTFGFRYAILDNSQIITTSDSQNWRQGFCQIDKNNFAFITDIPSGSRNGFSLLEMAKYMKSIGCINGLNLDGGGSISLSYKSSGDSNITSIVKSSREIADILYFTE